VDIMEKRKYLDPTVIRTPDRPAPDLAPTPTKPSQLKTYCVP